MPFVLSTEIASESDDGPGLLLFRIPRKSQLLLVFLAGETPTSGLKKSVMAAALRQLADFYPWGPEYDQLPNELRGLTQKDSRIAIKIMGPTFSGSAVSLDFTLRDWLAGLRGRVSKTGKPLPAFQIVSGTATAIDPQEFSPFGDGVRPAFQAVVPPDNTTMSVALHYIRHLGYARVAMLTEASTAYGQDQEYKQESKKEPKQESEPESTPEPDAQPANPPDASHPTILNLPFPLHISQLRTASEKQRLSQQKSTSELFNNPTPSIPLEEGEMSQPRETPPSFSQVEVSSAELVLSAFFPPSRVKESMRWGFWPPMCATPSFWLAKSTSTAPAPWFSP